MSDAMHIGATGMLAQQVHIDTIANNLVNVNTPGFKRARVGFTDLMVAEAARMSPASSAEIGLDDGVLGAIPHTGVGVGISNMSKVFDLGSMNPTGSAWDVAIAGDGFLPVVMPDGSTGYTRAGTLKVNTDGQLATQAGYPLKPNISIPSDATSFSIAPDGTVQVTVPRQTRPVQVGQLQLVRFSDAASLVAQGNGAYRANANTGDAIPCTPGQDGVGLIQQGVLEGSNVKMVDEMVNLILAQRTYEASVKVVQVADELQGMINNIRK
jgi:flagellar basal-body rod protein FlgG